MHNAIKYWCALTYFDNTFAIQWAFCDTSANAEVALEGMRTAWAGNPYTFTIFPVWFPLNKARFMDIVNAAGTIMFQNIAPEGIFTPVYFEYDAPFQDWNTENSLFVNLSYQRGRTKGPTV